MGGRGSSRFITILHRGGSPQFITILQRGGLQNLLQYYSFERKMEGCNPFSALNKLKGFHFILFNADLQGGFFDCSALKMTKCQPLKEISELFLPKND